MGILRRSEFLCCIPAGLWALACGESSAAKNQTRVASGGTETGGVASDGHSPGGDSVATSAGKDASGGTSSGGMGASGVSGAQSPPSSGGSVATRGGSGGVGSSAGAEPAANTGDAGSSSEVGSGGAPTSVACADDIGATANSEDFSMNTDTGEMDSHVLLMTKGDIVRRVLDYTTKGSADHQHEFRFTDAQLVALLAGEGVLVRTEGPPLNAASGHTHTVRVHACNA